ncbi:hypothetical protein EC919_11262 [Pseudomonas graminis]|nr:hypothetical protein EC919_11262 [Pseudomonas graminis]
MNNHPEKPALRCTTPAFSVKASPSLRDRNDRHVEIFGNDGPWNNRAVDAAHTLWERL